MLSIIGPLIQAIQAADVSLFKFINSHHTPFFDFFFSLFTNLGYGWVVYPPLLVLLLWKIPESPRRGRILVAAVVSLLISGLGNTVIKEIVGRARPAAYFIDPGTESVKGRAFGSPLARGLKPRASTAEVPPGFAVLIREAKRAGKPGASAAVKNPSAAALRRSLPEIRKERVYDLHLVDARPYRYSFPSGHTQTAFAIAAILTLIFGSRQRWAFFVAAMVAYSRIYLGVHFPLDTLAGAFFGWGLVRAVWPVALSIGRKKSPQAP